MPTHISERPLHIPDWAIQYDARRYGRSSVTGDVLAFSLASAGEDLRILVIERDREPFAGIEALPGGFVEADDPENPRAAATRELAEETGERGLTHIELLDVYGDFGRDPRQFAGHEGPGGEFVATGTRVFSVAHLALVQSPDATARPMEGEDARRATWTSVYEYLPWEGAAPGRTWDDVRALRTGLRFGLGQWIRSRPEVERLLHEAEVNLAFGECEERWDDRRCGARWALLSRAGLVEEATRDRWGTSHTRQVAPGATGRVLGFDHRRMLADALARLRDGVRIRPVLLQALLPQVFSATELRAALSSVLGGRLSDSSFIALLDDQGAAPLLLSAGAGSLYRINPVLLRDRLDIQLPLELG